VSDMISLIMEHLFIMPPVSHAVHTYVMNEEILMNCCSPDPSSNELYSIFSKEADN